MSSRGFSVIETLVAMIILVIIGSAIVSLTLTVISANTSAKLRNQGVGFAEEGIEQVRNYFATKGFQTLYNTANNTCYSDGTLAIVASCTPTNCVISGGVISSTFSRVVQLSRPSASSVLVKAIVYWPERGVCRNTEVGTYFYNF